MSTWLIFLQFVAAVICQQNFPNFDDMVSEFVSEKSVLLNRQVKWWDLYSNKDELKNNPAYSKYKLSVRVCNFVYGQTADVNQKPCSRDIRYFKNVNVSSGIKFVIQGTRELVSLYQWNISQGLQIDRAVNIQIPVPPLEKELAPPVWDIDIRKKVNKVLVGRHKFVFDAMPYEVKKNNIVKTEFHYIVKESLVTWNAVVELEGAVAVWYQTPYRAHNLWFYPLSEMATPLFTSGGQCRLRYPIKGMFSWIQQLNATIKVSRYKLGNKTEIDKNQKPDEVEFLIPTKLTLYGLKAVKLNYANGKFFRNKILMKKTL